MKKLTLKFVGSLGTATLVGALAAFSANAALLTADWRTFGDGLITRDSATRLEWLDLTVTDGQSYNEVAARLVGDLAGWRFASAPESESLFGAFGLPIEDSYGPNPAAAPAVALMVSFMGDTFTDYVPGFTGVYGFVDYSIFPGFHLQKGAFIDNFGDVRLYTGNLDGHANDSIRFSHMGSFLVRPAMSVPEPSIYSLVALGFLTLIVSRRKSSLPRVFGGWRPKKHGLS